MPAAITSSLALTLTAALLLPAGSSAAPLPPGKPPLPPQAEASALRLPGSVPPPVLLTEPFLPAEPCPPLPAAAPGGDATHLAAGPAFELPVLSALFHPAWDDLDETQQEILAPFAPEWNTWPMAERRSWLAFAGRMQTLPEAQRRRAHRRILEWANMSPEERHIARINHQHSRRHPMPERMRAWEHYRALSWAEREALRRAEAAEREASARHNGLARHPANPIPGQHPDNHAQGAVPMESLRTLIRRSWQPEPRPDASPAPDSPTPSPAASPR